MEPSNIPPDAIKGKVVIDPKTGDRRIRLSDLAPKKPGADEIELSLYQILKGELTIEQGKDRVVRLKPITLDGLATLEESYAAEGGLSVFSRRLPTTKDYVTFATIMANDHAPEGKTLTAKEVGKLLNAEQMPFISKLINELISGPLDAAAAADPGVTPAADGGPGSSTGAPNSSGGPPATSAA